MCFDLSKMQKILTTKLHADIPKRVHIGSPTVTVRNLAPFPTTGKNRCETHELLTICIGFICPRSLQNKTTHCCLHYSTSITASNSMRHVCTSCDSHSCCPTHEECVSCCLSPTHTTLRSFMLSLRSMKRYDVSEGDTFGLCVVLCRSNSRSVVHENAYRHERHHCFAGEPRVDGNLYRGIFDFAKPVGK